MATLDYDDILLQADGSGTAVERSSFGVKGCVKRREMGSVDFVRKIGEFLFFMRYGRRPGTVSDEDFRKYLIVVCPLVDKGQLSPSILALFGEGDVPDQREH
jgi:hypothetical protein